MRGFAKVIAMSALAGGMSVVPAIGSQGAGALGEQHSHADSQLLRGETTDSLHAADQLAAKRVIELARL